MLDIKLQVKNVIKSLENVADPDRCEYVKNYFPTNTQVIGVKIPDLRIVSTALDKQLKECSAEEVLEFALALLKERIFECQLIAYEVVSRHKETMSKLKESDVTKMGQTLDNWLTVDTFGALIAGPTWRDGRIPDTTLHSWAKSRDHWWRRVAIVCTVALNQKARGGRGDARRTLDICRIVADDHDDMVEKALSWALRELAKRDINPVKLFIQEHKDVLANRVIREVSRKITTGRK